MLLITDGQVLAAGDARPAAADVLVDGDRIVAVGPGLAAPPDATRLDAAGKLVVPGLINAHTHAHNNLIKGVADSVTLELFLNAGPAMQSEANMSGPPAAVTRSLIRVNLT